MKASFTVQYSPDRMVIEVTDLNDGGRSVTNDAEAVVQEVVRTLGDLPIMYCDSSEIWDELCHYKGRFTKFGPIGTMDLEEARQIMKERYER